jgi:hypothetical protein
MNEQTLYKSLLEGAIIGKINYADRLATLYANMIKKHEISPKNHTHIFERVILFYGDMLEQEEEEELRLGLTAWNIEVIITKLKVIEEIYSSYFLELISEGREKIEIIYQEVNERIGNACFDLTNVTEIKKAESLKDIELAGEAWKKIVKNENIATLKLYEKTHHSIQHYVFEKYGSKTESDDIWYSSFLEFRKKLNKGIQEEGYYRWEGTKQNHDERASITSFFIMICQRRWLSKIEKIMKNNNSSDKEVNIDEQEFDRYLAGEEDSQELLKYKMVKAISKLKTICQEIINGKWFGGEFGERISSKELALKIGYSEGYINNQHPKCLDDLKAVLQQS